MVSGKGIQVDDLERLINSLNGDITDIKASLPKLNDTVNILSEIFTKNELNNVVNNVQNIYGGQENISKILQTYKDVLNKVVESYKSQEEIVSISLQIVTNN